MDPWSACLLPVSFAAFFPTGSTQGPLPSSTIERVASASLFSLGKSSAGKKSILLYHFRGMSERRKDVKTGE